MLNIPLLTTFRFISMFHVSVKDIVIQIPSNNWVHGRTDGRTRLVFISSIVIHIPSNNWVHGRTDRRTRLVSVSSDKFVGAGVITSLTYSVCLCNKPAHKDHPCC